MTMFKVKQDAFLKERVMYSLFSLHAGFSILQHNRLGRGSIHFWCLDWTSLPAVFTICIHIVLLPLLYTLQHNNKLKPSLSLK